MRFRQRFPWLQIVPALLWIGLGATVATHKHAHAGTPFYEILGFIWLFILAFTIAGYYLIWWDITEAGLTERRFWRTKLIPWDEIYRVGPWRPYKKHLSDTLEVEYARTGPLSDRGHFVLLPLERQGFISAVKARASQAIFEL